MTIKAQSIVTGRTLTVTFQTRPLPTTPISSRIDQQIDSLLASLCKGGK